MRVSSTHYRYQELSGQFERSDVLFRLKHLLQKQASSLSSVAHSIQLGLPYIHDSESIIALDELQPSINHLQQQENKDWKSHLLSLEYLFNNLATVEKQLCNVSNPDTTKPEDGILQDTEAHTLKRLG